MKCPDGFWCLQFKDVLNLALLLVTAIAIIVGPIAAVIVTRKHDLAREKLRRRYDIFHKLMMTRRLVLAQDHVSALNAIQIEFNDDDKVITAYKKYIENLNLPVPAPSSDPSIFKHFNEQRDDAFHELIYALGMNLGFNFDRRDLAKYSYLPQGWVTIENQQSVLRQLMIEILEGRRGLPVTQFTPIETGKFPPPPALPKPPH